MRLLPRRSVLRSGVVAGVLACAVGATALSTPARADNPVARWVVLLKDSVSDPGTIATQQARPFAGKVRHVYDVAAGGYALKGYAIDATEQQIAAIRTDPRVESVQPDQVIHRCQPRPTSRKPAPMRPPYDRRGRGGVPFAGDPLRDLQWGLFQIGTSTETKVPASPRVGVAVLDTGVDLNHPDLQVAGALNFSGSPTEGDFDGHGTHVSEIIQAPNNSIGVVGAAQGIRLWSVKVLNDDSSFELSNIAAGLAWVAPKREDEEHPGRQHELQHCHGQPSTARRRPSGCCGRGQPRGLCRERGRYPTPLPGGLPRSHCCRRHRFGQPAGHFF